jgi:hypothetical protein
MHAATWPSLPERKLAETQAPLRLPPRLTRWYPERAARSHHRPGALHQLGGRLHQPARARHRRNARGADAAWPLRAAADQRGHARPRHPHRGRRLEESSDGVHAGSGPRAAITPTEDSKLRNRVGRRRGARLCASPVLVLNPRSTRRRYLTGCSALQSPLSAPFGLKLGSPLITYSFEPLDHAWSYRLLSSTVRPLAGSWYVWTPRISLSAP